MAEGTVEDPVLRTRYAFRRTVDEDGGEVLQVEMWIDPGGGAAPHLHHSIEERFNVLAGRPSFLTGRKWRQAAAGDTVVVASGVRHNFRNTGDETAHVLAEVRPPLELQEFLEDVAGLSRASKITQSGLPTGISGLLAGAVLAKHYRNTVVLLRPPPVIQRLLLGPVARLGERRGYKPGSLAQAS
jgi:quercetin dioxygenase-like cupin family protein